MKSLKKVLFMLITCSLPAFALAATTFTWQQPGTNTDGSSLTDLKGNIVYCGPAPGAYDITKDAGLPAGPGLNARYPISQVITKDGTYYCVVTAYDESGNESVFSNEIQYFLDQTPPAATTGFGVE